MGYQHTLHAHEEAPADTRSITMAQQTPPNQPQQGNKPGQPNPMPNKPGQSSQQSSSDQHDQSANKK
jgi:hypothetical protein